MIYEISHTFIESESEIELEKAIRQLNSLNLSVSPICCSLSIYNDNIFRKYWLSRQKTTICRQQIPLRKIVIDTFNIYKKKAKKKLKREIPCSGLIPISLGLRVNHHNVPVRRSINEWTHIFDYSKYIYSKPPMCSISTLACQNAWNSLLIQSYFELKYWLCHILYVIVTVLWRLSETHKKKIVLAKDSNGH